MKERNRGETPRTPLNKLLRVRISEEEYQRLKEYAEIMELNMSDIVREAIELYTRRYGENLRLKKSLRRRFKDKELEELRKEIRELAYQIRKIGVNLNQIARHVNEEKEVDLAVAIQLNEIREILNKLDEYVEELTRQIT